MLSSFRKLALAACLAAPLLFVTPNANADPPPHAKGHHKSHVHHNYKQPGVYYYSYPNQSRYYYQDYPYGSYYYDNGGTPYYYSNPYSNRYYYGNVYGTQRFHYRDFGHGGVLRIGPIRIPIR